MNYDTEKFNCILLCIQVWNIPPHWLSKEISFCSIKIFGSVVDVLPPERGSKRGWHLKILAEIDLNKLLQRGTKLRLDDNTVWVEFRYKKLVLFYFYCGTVCHPEKNCSIRLHDALNNNLQEGQFGDWLCTTTRKAGYNPLSNQGQLQKKVPGGATKLASTSSPYIAEVNTPSLPTLIFDFAAESDIAIGHDKTPPILALIAYPRHFQLIKFWYRVQIWNPSRHHQQCRGTPSKPRRQDRISS